MNLNFTDIQNLVASYCKICICQVTPIWGDIMFSLCFYCIICRHLVILYFQPDEILEKFCVNCFLPIFFQNLDVFLPSNIYRPYVWDSWSKWRQMERMSIHSMLGQLCDLDLWPHPWIDLGFSRSKFEKLSFISGMYGLIYMKPKPK